MILPYLKRTFSFPENLGYLLIICVGIKWFIVLAQHGSQDGSQHGSQHDS